MSIIKYTTKYMMISVLTLVVIIGIGWFGQSHRQKKEPQPVVIISIGWFGQSHRQKKKPQPVEQPESKVETPAASKVSVPKKGVKTTRSSQRKKENVNRSSLGWITWKYGRASGLSRSPYYRDWTPLPDEIKHALNLLGRVQRSRESLHNRLEDAKRDGWEIDLSFAVDFVGELRYLPEPRKLLLDKQGRPVPPMTDAEYKAEEFRTLVGDRPLEEATQFLEQHGHYYKLLLSRLDDERAFEYLYTLESPVRSFGPDDGPLARVYAERVVAADPAHLKARLYLADIAPRSSAADYESALAQYESILIDHPDSAHALIEAGDVLLSLDRPVQAVAFFNRGHQLGTALGFWEAGMAYQKLGDYKTAWVYLKKASYMQDDHGRFAVHKHLRAIAEGRPLIEPLPIEKLDIPDTGFFPMTPPPGSKFGFDAVPSETVLRPDAAVLDAPNKARAADAEVRAQARAQAKARFEEILRIREQMSQQEINDFIQWADALMRAETAMDPQDFLQKEMAAHLTGKPAQFSPDRIVRANELIKRYGYEAGLSRIIFDDPEIAIQIQLLRNQRPIPKSLIPIWTQPHFMKCLVGYR